MHYSFLSKDTTIIQANLDAILNSFISIADGSNTLIGNKNAELEELKNKYKNMLSDKKSSITQQKEELQKVYGDLLVVQKDSKESSDELLSIRIDHSKQMERLEGNIKDKNLIVEEYKNKNDMLLSDLQEYKQYKIELEGYKKLLSDAQARNIDKDNIIRDNDYNVNQLNKSIEKLSKDNQKELETLKKEYQLNIRLEVAKVKEELNNKFSQEQFKHNKEIEEYQSKYKELLEKLEKKRTIPKDTPKVIKKNNVVTKRGIDEKKIEGVNYFVYSLSLSKIIELFNYKKKMLI
ncbi:hypothetical protein [Clostridium sp.]|uniref:hypothetical protein n=1 Tax=Clostridium sp. TaxID=1506 RepID=UPI003D6C749B